MRHLASSLVTAGLAAALTLGLTAVSPAPAAAFCGFYVDDGGEQLVSNATQVVLMRHGTTTVLSMSNNYQGPPEAFALVVPVPVVVKEAQVKTLPREVFARVDRIGAPRLVEYWEQDPCQPYGIDPSTTRTGVTITQDYYRSVPPDRSFGVTIEAEFSVGEYDIVVLSAKESTGLDRWLRANKYQIPRGAEPLLRPYVESGTKFFVATLRVTLENKTDKGLPMTLARVGLPGGLTFQTWQLKELRDQKLVDFYETREREARAGGRHAVGGDAGGSACSAGAHPVGWRYRTCSGRIHFSGGLDEPVIPTVKARRSAAASALAPESVNSSSDSASICAAAAC